MHRIDLGSVQRRRKLVLLIAIIAATLVMFVMGPAIPAGTWRHYAIEGAGTALILLCIVGRTWTALYISGIKRVNLVHAGPYSIVRNPLYVFSVLGAAGVGLWTGSLSAGIVLGAVTLAVFHVVVCSEEKFLLQKFGADYAGYMAAVPRWLPAPARWQGAEWVTIRPALVTSTFIESSCFLLAIPVLEAVEYFQESGALPVLFRLV